MRRRTSFVEALVLGVGGAISAAAPALAMPITYTESATASGMLGATSFTNALVTLTMANDTNNVTMTTGPTKYHNVGTTTVTVSGVGSATFSDSIEVFDAQAASLVGFADVTHTKDILDDFNAKFATYDLKSFIGPTSGTAEFNTGSSFSTSGGAFILNSVTGPSSTFAAVPAPVIGRGLPVMLAFASLLFGVKLWDCTKKHRTIAT
jgi:hypothetical protein